MKLKKKKYLIVLILVLFFSIGFALLSSNLSINGLGIFKPNTWDIHFANIVDDSGAAELTVPATIDKDGLNINFDVDLNNLGDNYYFYVDIVNDGTIDAMIDNWKLSGITPEVENFIKASVTYADGVELNNYDLLPKKKSDKLKVTVEYTDEYINSTEELPQMDGEITLTLNINYIQADERATTREKRADNDSPVVRVNKSTTSIEGNNRWYKNLTLSTKLIDPSGISSAKYCATTSDSCTPDNPVELKNNAFDIRLDNSKTPWTICVETVDNEENTENYCDKNKYYVDGEDPTVSNITVTPADLSMRVELTSKDNYSGVDKYYYSKDGGANYISSDKPNYTFSSLEANDYIVMAYVEDVAGNKSDTVTKTTTVREYSWCEKNEITNLADCAIATEAHNADIAEAKKEIEDKGQPDFSKTSPTYTYKEKHSSDLTTTSTNNSTYASSTTYKFNNETGQYTLTNSTVGDIKSINLEDGNSHYSCLNSTAVSCYVLYKLESVSDMSSTGYYTISKYNYTYDVDTYDVTGIGMYASEDEKNTTSYYYRGSVGGNYVKFAGMYWRIVRINGDGSIRLIYFGDNTKQGKNALSSAFNNNYWDPTYEGYMYNDDAFSNTMKESAAVTFGNFNENTSYLFAKDYEWDESTKRFKLKGSTETGEIISGVWKNIHDEVINGGYIYSCFINSTATTCPILIKIKSYSGTNGVKGTYLSYSSTSYETATENVKPSNILTKLNSWYNSNIVGKNEVDNNSSESYIVDQVFCNDRSVSSTAKGNGYDLVPVTHYGAFNRLSVNKSPTFICPQENDKFTQSTDIGNGNLANYNPIGIITADEVAFAGATFGRVNPLYYLNYNDSAQFWTMSPAHFTDGVRASDMMIVNAEGRITEWSWVHVNTNGIRPIINLRKDVLISSGDGTQDNPYTLKLQ